MLNLLILRHAKSSWDEPDKRDFDRPLNGRGRKAAGAMGSYLAAEGLRPALILCSAARRTLETLDLVLPAFGREIAVSREEGLYLAGPTALLERLRQVEDGRSPVLLVGHNPGLHALALDLVRDGQRDDIVALGRKLPTCGLVEIALAVGAWRDVAPAGGRLTRYVTPARLP